MKKHALVAVAAGLVVATAGARSFAQDETTRVDDTSRIAERPPETTKARPNRPLLITGAAIIVASYTPALVVAATSGRDGDQYLYIPVAGPWIDLGVRGGCGPVACGTEGVYKAAIVATGVAHLVGVGAVVASLFVPERRRSETAATKPTVVPMQLGKGGYGLGVVGAF